VNVSAADNIARNAIMKEGAIVASVAMLRKSLSLLEDGETISKETQSDLVTLLRNLSFENENKVTSRGCYLKYVGCYT
jgi:ribonuclease D